MTTQKKQQSSEILTDKDLGNKLTEALATISDDGNSAVKELSTQGKIALMVVMLSRPEGATLKEMAESLKWKENSVRGAMSLYAKKVKATIASEKKDGVRTYYLKANA